MPEMKFVQFGEGDIQRVSLITELPIGPDWTEELNPAERRIVRDTMAEAIVGAQEWSKWSQFPTFRSSVRIFGTTITCIWKREES